MNDRGDAFAGTLACLIGQPRLPSSRASPRCAGHPTSGTLVTVKARKTAEPVRSPQPVRPSPHAAPPQEYAKPAYRPGDTPLDGRHSVPLLQGAAGNRAVTALLSGDPAVQRVPVTVPTRRETLFNHGWSSRR